MARIVFKFEDPSIPTQVVENAQKGFSIKESFFYTLVNVSLLCISNFNKITTKIVKDNKEEPP